MKNKKRYYVQDPGVHGMWEGEAFDDVWSALKFAESVLKEWPEVIIVDSENTTVITLKEEE